MKLVLRRVTMRNGRRRWFLWLAFRRRPLTLITVIDGQPYADFDEAAPAPPTLIPLVRSVGVVLLDPTDYDRFPDRMRERAS